MAGEEVEIPEGFVTGVMGKLSTQVVASSHTYDYKRIGGDVWLWANDVSNRGDHVYVGSETTRSQGFGGASLSFNVGEEKPIVLLGPWHSGSNSLFERTGIDLRKEHLTRGVIAKKRESTGIFMQYRYTEIVHLDPATGIVGAFDRIAVHAQKLANEHKCTMYFYSQSTGGSTSHQREPEE